MHDSLDIEFCQKRRHVKRGKKGQSDWASTRTALLGLALQLHMCMLCFMQLSKAFIVQLQQVSEFTKKWFNNNII